MSIQRTLRAMAWFPLLTVLVSLIGLGIPILIQRPSPVPSLIPTWPFYFLVFAAVFAVAVQTIVNCRKDWYNPTLALKYEDLFDSKPILKARATAAKQFQKDGAYNANSKEIETVLDVFETIGFYVMHDEISPEVAHHHFDYWIRGYVETAEEYIKDRRRKAPTIYEHVEYLLAQTSTVEAKKLHKHLAETRLSQEEIKEFIIEEVTADK
jgi:hypothetical protein